MVQYHNTIDALVFDQSAAEDYALYVQSFALAKLRLDAELARRKTAGAAPNQSYLVTDCDETVLDNGAYNAWLIETGRDFHADTWRQWCRDKQARATPGAVDFANYAASVGVEVCYVSSRFEDTRTETAANLQLLGFPLPDASPDPATSRLFLDGMLLNGTPSKKELQFAWLKQRFGADPLVQLGDNLSDHDAKRYSSRLRYSERGTHAEQDRAKWGAEWIVFPNSVYGSWRLSLKLASGGVDFPVADEPVPVPSQAAPVRPPVTPAEAPKVAFMQRWAP